MNKTDDLAQRTRAAFEHVFLIQDERAQIDGPFDTFSIMGWDDTTGRYFVRSFENHGFYRHYDLSVEGKVWIKIVMPNLPLTLQLVIKDVSCLLN